eukprot:TRINITY_DN40381_c0_g1_i1.p1 TRINITY_DN40381_c0_g1~~TRINITY_DN40381_c0_g1_i1.p1  ORF type:complete len:626 (-),score=146.28 TRINITY_DN40381_c0_g1_i1:8-1843(-)
MTAALSQSVRPSSPLALGTGSPLARAGQNLFSSSQGKLSRPPSAGSSTKTPYALKAEKVVLNEAGVSLETLRNEVLSLEAKLKDTLRPRLREATSAATSARSRVVELNKALEALAEARRQAAEQLGTLTKRQLSEIRQLLRSPPEAVKRTLAAVWLILNSGRFRGKPASAVRFDDNADWPRCQRMLADEGFVASILSFDPACLDEVPTIPQHVASVYLGLGSVQPETKSPSSIVLGRSSLRRSSTGVPKQPLDPASVTRASEPCGSLLRWVQELVIEHVERTKVQAQLVVAERDLKTAEASEGEAECDVAETEASLSNAKRTLAEREEQLLYLQREKAAAEKAARDVQKLEGMMAVCEKNKTEKKSKSQPKKEEKKMEAVELEVNGTLASVEQKLAQLGIPFASGAAAVLEGDASQVLIMPKIAEILKEHKGKLKIQLEGHRETNEPEGLDVERSLAVYQWLVEVAGCAPGLLRLKGQAAKAGLGRCTVPVPIQELIPRKGPLPAEQQELMSCPRGLYFAQGSCQLLPETQAIVAEMAKCIDEDEYTVRIEGHIDKDEPPTLAKERAEAVKAEMVKLGVSRMYLKLETCKSFHPMSRRHMAANRRVEVHLA